MKLSIITINRNNAAGLDKTIGSIRMQDYSDIEYIVIDGASTDGSVEVIHKHQHHITAWISEPDSGIYNAMNKGISRATGDYVLFMNSGDTLASESILSAFVSGRYQDDIVFGNQIRLYADGTTDLWEVNNQPIDVVFFHRRGIPHQSTFTRRDIFDKYGSYREDLPIFADWELAARAVLVHGATIRHIPLAVCIYDMSGVSTTTDRESRLREREQAKLGLFSKMVWDNVEQCYQLRKELDHLQSKWLVRMMMRLSASRRRRRKKSKHPRSQDI